jgi:hypothetical protein
MILETKEEDTLKFGETPSYFHFADTPQATYSDEEDQFEQEFKLG